MQSTKPRCGAKVRNARGDNTTCRAWPVRGSSRCRMHGGGSEQYGVANPAFRNGKYAKLPARLLEDYQAAIADPELLGLREDIAVNDARIAELSERLYSGESGAMWRELRQAQQQADEARRAGQRAKDPLEKQAANARLGEALSRIRDLIIAGHSDYAAWTELRAAQDHGRKLRESERKRVVEMHQTVQSDKALAWARALMDAVEAEVSDRDVLARISRKAMAIINRQEAA